MSHSLINWLPSGVNSLQCVKFPCQTQISHPRTRTGPDVTFTTTAGVESVPRTPVLVYIPKNANKKEYDAPSTRAQGSPTIGIGFCEDTRGLSAECCPGTGIRGGLNAGKAGRGPAVGLWELGEHEARRTRVPFLGALEGEGFGKGGANRTGQKAAEPMRKTARVGSQAT